MKIEHWHCQEVYPSEQLDYGNLLGACLGGQGHPREQQHCDTHKGSLSLSRNPANLAHDIEGVIQYRGDGEIRSSDPVFDRELDDVLNLNHPRLKSNRKAALDAFRESMKKLGPWNEVVLSRKMEEWSALAGGELKPYCQIVVYYLRKRLARA